MDFSDGGVEDIGGKVGHEDGSAFTDEEDGCFESDAARVGKRLERA